MAAFRRFQEVTVEFSGSVTSLAAGFRRLQEAVMLPPPPNQFTATENDWCIRCGNFHAARRNGLCPVCLDDDRCRSLVQAEKKVTNERQ